MVASGGALVITNRVFKRLRYLPIEEHYYEPLVFSAKGGRLKPFLVTELFSGKKDFSNLAGIAIPDEFVREYNEGVIRELGFRFGNGSFESGDAETLFYQVRSLRPKKIVEIGAGHSSLIISAALVLNLREGFACNHVIVEPYENPWLDELNATVLREKVENLDLVFFKELSDNDILFIDSSHVVRTQNDCVFEYTEIFPSLNSGVVVHVHDIFTPYDYPDEWLNERYYLWAEQYLVEAILVNSTSWQVVAPLNWLSKDTEQFQKLCPFFSAERSPGSFWLKKIVGQ
jgi:hypothetical protein